MPVIIATYAGYVFEALVNTANGVVTHSMAQLSGVPLIDILRTIGSRSLRRLALMAVVAALSNAMVLALINMAAERDSKQSDGNTGLVLAFIVVVLLYSFSQRFLMYEAAKEVETLIHGIRSRLIESVRRAELSDTERIGQTRIFNGISKEIQTLAQSSALLAVIFQMAMLVVFTVGYLMLLSTTAFLLAVVFIGLAVILYLGRTRQVNKAVQRAAEAEYRLDELLQGVLGGFKELKLNKRRSDELTEDLLKASAQAADDRLEADQGFAKNFIFSQNVWFLLLGIMVFVVPVLSAANTYDDVLLKTTTVILFVMGPLGGLVGSVPILTNANGAAARILELDQLLGKVIEARTDVAMSDAAWPESFREIELRGVTFVFESSSGQSAFQVGPVDLSFRAGETVFISGGNGSGKSTFLRLLTALYLPHQGSIFVDGTLITPANISAYRGLFSTVFSDYYLFKRLYGIDPGCQSEASDLLRLFAMDDKTSVVGNEFTTVDLSAGQRKRLALIVAVLEHRPICILDEWAADQDPLFRKKFYNELLKTLTSRGITVIAVTHDDRYYDRADRRLHMEEGKITDSGQETAHA